MTLGMLKIEQAEELATAGLDYYNHNLETSENSTVISLLSAPIRCRLDTLNNVHNAGMKVYR